MSITATTSFTFLGLTPSLELSLWLQRLLSSGSVVVIIISNTFAHGDSLPLWDSQHHGASVLRLVMPMTLCLAP
eukprot:6289718-Amphidinium_carterae.1